MIDRLMVLAAVETVQAGGVFWSCCFQAILEAAELKDGSSSQVRSGTICYDSRKAVMLTGLPTPPLKPHQGEWRECCWPECC